MKVFAAGISIGKQAPTLKSNCIPARQPSAVTKTGSLRGAIRGRRCFCFASATNQSGSLTQTPQWATRQLPALSPRCGCDFPRTEVKPALLFELLVARVQVPRVKAYQADKAGKPLGEPLRDGGRGKDVQPPDLSSSPVPTPAPSESRRLPK